MGAKQSNNYRNPPSKEENIQQNNYKNKTETITLDEVYECLEDYKQVINNVYVLNKL